MGFLSLDYYFKIKGLQWNEKPKFSALWGREGDVHFIKPQEFYNASGEVVARYVKFYKIALSDILVICDNFDLGFGLVRERSSGSAGGNNGLKSIDAALGSSDYARIRVGTENNALRSQMGDVDFVLSRFTPEDKEKLPEILTEITKRIDEAIRG